MFNAKAYATPSATSSLTNSILELNEAAYLLGYEDVSSFTRAFRA